MQRNHPEWILRMHWTDHPYKSRGCYTTEDGKPNNRRVIIDKKIESRDNHLKALRKLVKEVRGIDQLVDEHYSTWQHAPNKAKKDKEHVTFRKADEKLQRSFPKFFYKQKVIEEMCLVADNIHDKFQTSLRTIRELEGQKRAAQVQAIIHAEERKTKALEEFDLLWLEVDLFDPGALAHSARQFGRIFVGGIVRQARERDLEAGDLVQAEIHTIYGGVEGQVNMSVALDPVADVGRSMLGWVHPDDVNEATRIFLQSVTQGYSWPIAVRARRSDVMIVARAHV